MTRLEAMVPFRSAISKRTKTIHKSFFVSFLVHASWFLVHVDIAMMNEAIPLPVFVPVLVPVLPLWLAYTPKFLFIMTSFCLGYGIIEWNGRTYVHC